MKSFKIALIAAFAVACGNAEKTDLEVLKEQRDSLKGEYETLAGKISALDLRIAKYDTTKKLTKVRAVDVAPAKFEHYFEVYGNVEADENILMYPETQGEIEAIYVSEGEYVSKGKLLLKIDSEILEKNLEEINTQLELMKTLYEKQEKLWEQKIGSELQYLQAKNNYESTVKRKEALKEQIKMANVRAPFSGYVDDIIPKVGELAGPQTALLRLINTNNVYIKADVSEAYINKIENGTEVNVSISSIGYSEDAKITQTGRYINPANRTFQTRVDIKNSDNELKPNLLAVLKIKDFASDSAISVPTSLIQQTPQGDNYVYIVGDLGGNAAAMKTLVEIGYSYNGMTQIVSGINGAATIISDGSRSVQDQQLIEVESIQALN